MDSGEGEGKKKSYAKGTNHLGCMAITPYSS